MSQDPLSIKLKFVDELSIAARVYLKRDVVNVVRVKMLAIRRMKALGLDTFTLLDFYIKEVRVHLELAVLVWHGCLTIKLFADLERVQRVAISIILGQYHQHYIQACSHLGLKPLFIRRQKLCKRFALKTVGSDSSHSQMFQLEKDGSHYTRGDNQYRKHLCSKKRFFLT